MMPSGEGGGGKGERDQTTKPFFSFLGWRGVGWLVGAGGAGLARATFDLKISGTSVEGRRGKLGWGGSYYVEPYSICRAGRDHSKQQSPLQPPFSSLPLFSFAWTFPGFLPSLPSPPSSNPGEIEIKTKQKVPLPSSSYCIRGVSTHRSLRAAVSAAPKPPSSLLQKSTQLVLHCVYFGLSLPCGM